ncbi:MAG: YbhB/YbcL family Raf kinase inhibitor-like protein [Ferrimicrobium sp.]|uniref:YbhB/YbcL family Raf kinase inhibitor-like protein n=1 Tax=Ferrimicrobium sp. TaxID=2926050 RepID=UPI002627A424|nr:YbhB/YbcL family Raf kinase inhibitor-like protein [Ferrimicrobium sp.]
MASIGKLLRGFRAGTQHSVWDLPGLMAPDAIHIASQDFADGGQIPLIHSGKGVGQNRSPELTWSGVPDHTVQLLFIIEDTDVPLPRPILHTIALLEPQHSSLPIGGLDPKTEGLVFLPATFGRRGYEGPRPLPGHGPHHYGFCLWALATKIPKPNEIKNFPMLLDRVSGTALARGRLIGLQER